MRKLSVLVSLLFILSLTGCAVEYNLSEGDTNLVAESVASLLLKYDYNYRDKVLLLPKAEIPSSAENDTSAGDILDGYNIEDKANNAIDEGDSTDVNYLDIDESVIHESTLTEVIGDENINIDYKDYGLYSTYPTDDVNSYFSLTASKGKQLLVLGFTAKNVTEESHLLNLLNSKVRFRLSINNSKTVNPLYAVFENSLMFVNHEINPQKEEELILVFEINSDDINTSSFIAFRDDMLYKVKLK